MIDLTETKRVEQQRISDWDIGSTFFYANRVLMVKSSNQLLFFRLEIEQDSIVSKIKNRLKWVKYLELDVQGFFVSMKDSDMIQIVTDELVYFYEFDKSDESFVPKLKNVMNNFMGCISLQVDNKDKVCVTYKSGQPNFTTYKRKYDHGFLEIIDPTSREGCCGINIPSKNCFLISDDDYVQIHDEKTYKM